MRQGVIWGDDVRRKQSEPDPDKLASPLLLPAYI